MGGRIVSGSTFCKLFLDLMKNFSLESNWILLIQIIAANRQPTLDQRSRVWFSFLWGNVRQSLPFHYLMDFIKSLLALFIIAFLLYLNGYLLSSALVSREPKICYWHIRLFKQESLIKPNYLSGEHLESFVLCLGERSHICQSFQKVLSNFVGEAIQEEGNHSAWYKGQNSNRHKMGTNDGFTLERNWLIPHSFGHVSHSCAYMQK